MLKISIDTLLRLVPEILPSTRRLASVNPDVEDFSPEAF